MKTVKIILSNKFNRSVSTRAAVENLFKDLIAEEVVIDFSDIYFISSSAAHQMITEIKLLAKKNVKVSCENTNADVSRMLELSKSDRKNIFTVTPRIKHYVVKSESDLSKLLSGAI
jgi:anti-anti-sigma regulatory factor